MRRLVPSIVVFLLAASACSDTTVDGSSIPELPAATSDEVMTLLGESEQPVVINVWASWCIPCRSEAPLLDRAIDRFGSRVRFIGINVRDSQSGAREFIAEFFADAPIEYLFDRDGAIPPALGGSTGVPLTFFYEPGGGLVELHFGVLDERTLAFQIDELLQRAG